MLGKMTGGAGGIRTLDRALQPYNGLALVFPWRAGFGLRLSQARGPASVSAALSDGGRAIAAPYELPRVSM